MAKEKDDKEDLGVGLCAKCGKPMDDHPGLIYDRPRCLLPSERLLAKELA